MVLVVAAFQNDFSIAYIFHHSNRDLPAPYKFATLWSGQEGSLLFWSLLLAAYGFVLRLRYKTDPRLFAYASVVLAGVQIFFLLLVNFAANPFGQAEFEKLPDKHAGDFKVPAGQSVTFRYRFYFHEGDTDQAKVADHYNDYVAAKK